jgi:hypothetical protein
VTLPPLRTECPTPQRVASLGGVFLELILVPLWGRGRPMHGFLAEHLGVFDPDDIRVLRAAFDKAWEAVQASGVIYAKDQTELVRALLAKHIIAAAKAGDYDQGRLRDGALWPWLNQVWATRPIRNAGRPEKAITDVSTEAGDKLKRFIIDLRTTRIGHCIPPR